jgi:arylsulfatase A-like enzyme
MRRGAVLAWISALAVLSACAGCASSLALSQEAPPSEPSADPPNVVLVLTDDMRYEEFEKVARFREFVREGTFFERAYVTNSMCCPSRSTALTGRYSHNHGVLSNKTRGSVRGGYGAYKNLGTGAHNLAVWLQEEGYATSLYGKFMNGYGMGNDRPPGGFDRFTRATRAGRTRISAARPPGGSPTTTGNRCSWRSGSGARTSRSGRPRRTAPPTATRR